MQKLFHNIKITGEPNSHNIKITGEPNSIYRKVFLDGQELVGVRSCYIGYEVDSIPRAFIEIQTPNIEVEDYDIPVLMTPVKGDADGDVPPACRCCSNHPSNGGSGICHCTLGSQTTT